MGRAAIIILIALGVAVGINQTLKYSDCADKGGAFIAVNGFYKCVAVKEIK